MKIKSKILNCLIVLFLFTCKQANAQKDSTWYIYAGGQTCFLNSFMSSDFKKDWTSSAEKTNIGSVSAGIMFRSHRVNRNWSGLLIEFGSTSSDAMTRSKYVNYTEQSRPYSYLSTESFGLKMTSIGFVFVRTFKPQDRSGFFISPAILFSNMKEKFIRDVNSESKAESTGLNLVTGVMLYPVRQVGMKVLIGYRSLKETINAFDSSGEVIDWSGPYLGVGISLAIP